MFLNRPLEARPGPMRTHQFKNKYAGQFILYSVYIRNGSTERPPVNEAAPVLEAPFIGKDYFTGKQDIGETGAKQGLAAMML